MKNITLFFGITFLMGINAYAQLPLPENWKALTIEDFKTSPDYLFYKEKNYLETVGDFDGDNVEDQASLLKKEDNSEYALFITHHDQNHNLIQFPYFNTPRLQDIFSMGVETKPKGTYKTACGKGLWNCKDNEKAEIIISNPAVEFFTFESASRIIYWNNTSNKFEEVWISD